MKKQIERIKLMEKHLECASEAVARLSDALEDYAGAQESLKALESYYGHDDEMGLLPPDLKRGVLSEDGIWNLLSDASELNKRLQRFKAHSETEVL